MNCQFHLTIIKFISTSDLNLKEIDSERSSSNFKNAICFSSYFPWIILYKSLYFLFLFITKLWAGDNSLISEKNVFPEYSGSPCLINSEMYLYQFLIYSQI